MRKKSDWNIIVIVILAVALVAVSFLYLNEHKKVVSSFHKVVKIDTVTVCKRDTVTLLEPLPNITIITDTVYIKYNDTIRVPVPISTNYYKGTDYTAQISGYAVSLDRISVFPLTTTKYITKTVQVKEKAKKWGIGISAGYGAYKGKGLTPYIGVGITYNFIRF